eukprot:212787-Hanusia_phi.AAC.1
MLPAPDFALATVLRPSRCSSTAPRRSASACFETASPGPSSMGSRSRIMGRAPYQNFGRMPRPGD